MSTCHFHESKGTKPRDVRSRSDRRHWAISDEDLESLALYQSPGFQAMIERARGEHRNGASMSANDVRREFGTGWFGPSGIDAGTEFESS